MKFTERYFIAYVFLIIALLTCVVVTLYETPSIESEWSMIIIGLFALVNGIVVLIELLVKIKNYEKT